jgi:site-specific DNA-methyltransferase (adenine-specific)
MPDRVAPGKIRDAIVAHLRTQREASLDEIRDAVRARVNPDVAASSVRSYLQINTPRMFVRTARGRYALQGVPDQLDFSERAVKKVFSHGQAELYAGDCIDWLRQREPQSVHAVVTDPPYGLVEYAPDQQRKMRSGHGGVWRIPPAFDGHTRAPLPRFTTLRPDELRALESFFNQWAKVLLPVLVPGAHVLIASNPLLSYLIARAVTQAGFERRGEVIRLVMTMRGGDKPKNAHDEFGDVTVMPRSMWEPWLLFRKPIEGRVQDNLRKWKTGGLRRVSVDQPFGDVIQSHPTRTAERKLAPHPSLKPQAFLRQIVRAALPLGEGVVLDPFCGSGSTLAAAEAMNYRSIGVESDPLYLEVARDAIPKLAALIVSSQAR